MRALFLTLLLVGTTQADERFPRVYGSTGRLYGATMAHAQYQRQYGRPWHGYRGLKGPRRRSNFIVPYVPYAPIYPIFGRNVYHYLTPPVVVGNPGYFAPWVNPAFGYGPLTAAPFSVSPYSAAPFGFGGTQTIVGGGSSVGGSLSPLARPPAPRGGTRNQPAGPIPARPHEIEPDGVPIQPVAAGDPVAALAFQTEGDRHLRAGKHRKAHTAYRASIEADRNRAHGYFRMAFLFTAMGRHEPAIRYLKQGLDFAPRFPADGDRLSEIYSARYVNVKDQSVAAVLRWADEDEANPDRMLLAGAMLHFDGQPERAATYLKRAAKLSRHPSRAAALLSANDPVDGTAPEPRGLFLNGRDFANPPEPDPRKTAKPTTPTKPIATPPRRGPKFPQRLKSSGT